MAFSGSALAGFNQGWEQKNKNERKAEDHDSVMAKRALDMSITQDFHPLKMTRVTLQNDGLNIGNHQQSLNYSDSAYASPLKRRELWRRDQIGTAMQPNTLRELGHIGAMQGIQYPQALSNARTTANVQRIQNPQRVANAKHQVVLQGINNPQQVAAAKQRGVLQGIQNPQQVSQARHAGVLQGIEQPQQVAAANQRGVLQGIQNPQQVKQANHTGALQDISNPQQITAAKQQGRNAALDQAFKRAQVTGNVTELEQVLTTVFPDTDGKPDPVRLMPQADGSVVVENEGRQQRFASLGHLYQLTMKAAGTAKSKPMVVSKGASIYDPGTGKFSQPEGGAIDLYGGDLVGNDPAVAAQILGEAGLTGQALAQGVDEVLSMGGASAQANAYEYAQAIKSKQNIERTTQHILNLTLQEIQQKAGVDLSGTPLTNYDAKEIAEDLIKLPPEQRESRLIAMLKRKHEVETMRQMGEVQTEQRRYEGTDFDVD